MIGFRDTTFCQDATCKRFGVNCHRAYDHSVHAAARKWWGTDEYPITVYMPTAYPLDCKEPRDDSAKPQTDQ